MPGGKGFLGFLGFLGFSVRVMVILVFEESEMTDTESGKAVCGTLLLGKLVWDSWTTLGGTFGIYYVSHDFITEHLKAILVIFEGVWAPEHTQDFL